MKRLICLCLLLALLTASLPGCGYRPERGEETPTEGQTEPVTKEPSGPQTETEPQTETKPLPGDPLLWPADKLPEGFPVLCPEVSIVDTDVVEPGTGKRYCLIVAVEAPDWREVHTFISALVDAGWGSLEASFSRILTEGGMKVSEEERYQYCLWMRDTFDDEAYCRENGYTYRGSDGTYDILVSQYPADAVTEGKCRFVMYVSDTPAPAAHVSRSVPCTVDLPPYWEAEDEDDRLILVDAADPYGWSMITLIYTANIAGSDLEGYVSMYREAVSAQYPGITFERSAGKVGGNDSVILTYAMKDDLSRVTVCVTFTVWQDAADGVWQATLSSVESEKKTAERCLDGILRTFRTSAAPHAV